MLDRSRVMTHTKRRYPRRPSWGLGCEAILTRNLITEKPNNGRWKDNTGQRNDRNVRIT